MALVATSAREASHERMASKTYRLLTVPARSSDVRFDRLKRTLQQEIFAPAFATKVCYIFCSESAAMGSDKN